MGLGLFGLLSAFQIANPLQQIPQAVIDSSPIHAAEIENLLIKNAAVYEMPVDSANPTRKQTCWADRVFIDEEPVIVMTCKTMNTNGINRILDLSTDLDTNYMIAMHDIDVLGHAFACSFGSKRGIPFHTFNDMDCDVAYHILLEPVRTALKEKYARRQEP